MTIKLDIKGLRSTVSYVKKAQSTLNKNLRGANLGAIIVLDRWVQKNFASQGGEHKNNFGPWKKLSLKTIAGRRKGSSKILQDTGRLKNSFEFKASSKGAVLFTRVKYAKKHEFGEGRIPQRKIMPSDKQAEEIIKPVYKKFAERSVKK